MSCIPLLQKSCGKMSLDWHWRSVRLSLYGHSSVSNVFAVNFFYSSAGPISKCLLCCPVCVSTPLHKGTDKRWVLSSSLHPTVIPSVFPWFISLSFVSWYDNFCFPNSLQGAKRVQLQPSSAAVHFFFFSCQHWFIQAKYDFSIFRYVLETSSETDDA